MVGDVSVECIPERARKIISPKETEDGKGKEARRAVGTEVRTGAGTSFFERVRGGGANHFARTYLGADRGAR